MCDGMKSIGFTSSLAEQVRKGAKTSTYRLGKKYAQLTQGERVYAKCSTTSESFAVLEVTNISCMCLADIPLSRNGHRTYPTRGDLQQDLQAHYNEIITDETNVWVIDFALAQIL